MMASSSGATLRVQQVKSGIGYRKSQKATLKALGLGKVGRVRELPDNPQTRAQIATVGHLVRIQDEQRSEQ